MKKVKLCSLFLLITIFSCSKNNENEIQEELSMEIGFSTKKFEVDQPIYFNLKSNQNIVRYGISTDNVTFTDSNLKNYGKTVDINLSIDKVGKNLIYVFIQNEQNEILKKNFEIEIVKGSTVKIKNLKIISFKNINGIWDSEYSNSDINRLADLQFSLRKTYIKTSFNNKISFSQKVWYLSDILINQGNLTWDLNNRDLNIDPNLKIAFALGDVDGEGYGNVIVDYPDYFEFNFKDYVKDKPNRVRLKRNDIKLEIELELEW